MTINIYLDPMEVSLCEEFAQNSVDTHLTHYKARGQSSRDKIIRDITVGKMGEVALFNYLSHSKCNNPTPPDFEIYKGRRKKFSSDIELHVAGITPHPIHVKTQDKPSADKYGDSWLFQWGGAGFGHTDKVFKSYDDTELFAALKVNGVKVTLLGIWRLKDIFDNDLFKEPRLAWFKNSKKALYLTDITESGIDNLINIALTSIRL